MYNKNKYKVNNDCYIRGGKMEKVYNKLVRDNIPDIIEENNEITVTRILSDDEYRIELYN